MAMTLLGYRALMAELHSDDRRRQARTTGKARCPRHSPPEGGLTWQRCWL